MKHSKEQIQDCLYMSLLNIGNDRLLKNRLEKVRGLQKIQQMEELSVQLKITTSKNVTF